MKAAYYEGSKTIRIGDGKARAPGPDEVRLNVAYCGICGTDVHVFSGHMDTRVKMPHVMGHEMSGMVAEVGSNVNDWKSGDRVVVRPLDYCGNCPSCNAGHSHICQNMKFIGIDSPGAFQSSWTVPAHTLHRLPDAVEMDMGALIEPIAVACHDVRLGGVRSGEYVVVIGGGPIGMLIGLVSRKTGARVLISEINPFRIQFARELGYEVVDAKETDLAAYVEKQTDGAGADVVFEVSASEKGATVMTQLPRTRGRIVVVGIFSQKPRVDLFRFFWRELKLCGARVYEPEDYEKAISIAATGELPLDQLVSARYPLADFQKGLEQIESGADIMKILIDVKGE